MESTGCNCTRDTLCPAEGLCPAKDLFHELTTLQRNYASEYEQEAARAAFYEHRAGTALGLAGFSARGMLSDRRT